ncbi:hypothetical protein [Ovoidimarina sediminis]|uniref:hypothetical protein n=1 Tax=Ovoidimarina sediminis TaxID=3079856 RepID=UPI00292D37D4|nr:hypothetical protein [Rhodophyticola sp. MJ-SS7]
MKTREASPYIEKTGIGDAIVGPHWFRCFETWKIPVKGLFQNEKDRPQKGLTDARAPKKERQRAIERAPTKTDAGEEL